MSTISVRLDEGYKTSICIRNHTVIADEHIQDGGTDIGPTPMEMLLGTAGACVAVTTKAYALRKGWPLEGVSVGLEMERVRREDDSTFSGDAPFFHRIHEHIHFDGPLTDEQKARLMVIAGKCPVHATLANPVFFDQQLVETEPLTPQG